MRVFMTGATGFVGSRLVIELLDAGHEVLALSRSESGARALLDAGAEVSRGDVNDLNHLRSAARSADAVIHAAFNHDFAKLKQHSEADRRVIEALGDSLAGSDRPFIVTSGTGLVRSTGGGPALETDPHVASTEFARAATEEAADALMAGGARVMVLRLPQVHDNRRYGRINQHIELARQHGRAAYVGQGANRLPAVHISDAVRAYRLVLEKGLPGARYHAVAEEGISLRDISIAIGATLQLPVESIAPQQAPDYFGWLASLVTIDLAASGALTRHTLGWNPSGPGLLTDLQNMDRTVFHQDEDNTN